MFEMVVSTRPCHTQILSSRAQAFPPPGPQPGGPGGQTKPRGPEARSDPRLTLSTFYVQVAALAP